MLQDVIRGVVMVRFASLRVDFFVVCVLCTRVCCLAACLLPLLLLARGRCGCCLLHAYI
jgi:hypothetical protein